MKGVILAGGRGSRLAPLTRIANKHLLPVYDRPMILYPLETLKALGLEDILVVSGGEHIGDFAEFLGDGSEHGVSFSYRVQKGAGGIAEALGLTRSFAGSETIVVVLGDNIFENDRLSWPDGSASGAALLFGKRVDDPHRFGVIEFDENGTARRIVEKPPVPTSNMVVTGLYGYPPDVFDVISTLTPSGRGELEITDVNNFYIENGRCMIEEFAGFWSDAGTFDSLLRSAQWVHRCRGEK